MQGEPFFHCIVSVYITSSLWKLSLPTVIGQNSHLHMFSLDCLICVKNLQFQAEKRSSSLKQKLASVAPLVEDLKMKKDKRLKQFADVKAQIEKISGEISGYSYLNCAISSLSLDDQDLSLRKLNEFQTHLHTLQTEKVISFQY